MYKPKRILELAMWGIVSIYNEFIFDAKGVITFETELDAQSYCDKINVCNDGGVITNFT